MEERLSGAVVFGCVEHYRALSDRRVGFWREADEGAEFAEVRGAGDGEGDKASLRVPGFGELGRLTYVFGDDELAGNFGCEVETGEGFGGSKAVGSVQTIGD